jgi:hypothetical protein
LINFAYNFINRTASMAIWQDAMTKLLGSSVKLDAVRNLDADATKRRTRPLHFEKSERLQLL